MPGNALFLTRNEIWSAVRVRASALRPSASHEIRLSIHHPHPLVIEEAARSGLFALESTAGMLVLARDMRAHTTA
jgi:hypothetical protein